MTEFNRNEYDPEGILYTINKKYQLDWPTTTRQALLMDIFVKYVPRTVFENHCYVEALNELNDRVARLEAEK